MNKKILIIEDNTMLATLLAHQFEGQGFTVSVAYDGEEGLNKIFSERPDAVVLDIVMPKKDGVQVLKELHEKEPDTKLPVIVLTNSNDMNTVADAIMNKAAAYLIKSDQNIQNIVDMVKQKMPNT